MSSKVLPAHIKINHEIVSEQRLRLVGQGAVDGAVLVEGHEVVHFAVDVEGEGAQAVGEGS